jgi:menaquinone-9 beta-reductase
MEYHKTIIVGGGPAGSSCAWQLKKNNEDVLILDKQTFPRLKLCAGWIPEQVMQDLECKIEDYPHSILPLTIKIYFGSIPFPLLGNWAISWRKNYSIRRIEFDHWLLQRSQAPVIHHQVQKIERQGDYYIIDEQYQCQYLVGAGGTGCPVRRHFFRDQRVNTLLISTIEKEFQYHQRDDIASLFFLAHGLKGYSWYVPKGNGFVNIGLGAFSSYFTQSHTHIHDHFQWFLADLVKRGLLDQETSQNIKATGHGYYLFSPQGEVKKDNCFLIGDSAGLASLDMAEGIRIAVESGLAVAKEILTHQSYQKENLPHFSFQFPFSFLVYFMEKIWGFAH